MQFGLVNSAATFTHMMRLLLIGLDKSEHYIDDVLTHSQEWNEHLCELRKLFERVRTAGLTMKPSKCKLGFSSVDYLGHILGEGVISPNPDKLFNIQQAPRPQTKKKVRSFLGLVGFYSKFIPNYSTVAKKECLALIWAIRKLHVYLYGKDFIFETDHQPLVYLRQSKMENRCLMR